MHEEKILEEIYQNANTGIYSIETILPKVEDAGISAELISHQAKLEQIARTAQQMMLQKHIDPSDAGVMSKMGIWTGVQLNAIRDNSNSHIADMVIKGDTMGITKMTREMNHSPVEDPQIRSLGEELINIQRGNIETLKKYL
jgi:hypothetical protein